MNIQIFGKKKCFATKKAERFFKERRIKFQFIDIVDKGFSGGELKSILQAVGRNALIDDKHALYEESAAAQCQDTKALADILYDYYEIVNTPVVRNGKLATVGNAPDIWQEWLKYEEIL